MNVSRLQYAMSLQTRDLGPLQIAHFVSIAARAILGGSKRKIDIDETLENAFSGMDDALLQGAHASCLALQQLASQRPDVHQPDVRKRGRWIAGSELSRRRTNSSPR